MNAPTDIQPTLAATLRIALTGSNAWVGRYVKLFARGERSVRQCLAHHENSNDLPMLIGQQLEQLAKGTSQRPKAANALAAFRDHSLLRNLIVHNEGRVFVDGKGRWLLHFDVVDRNGHTRRTIVEDEAETLCRELHQTVQRLESLLHPTKQTPGRGDTPSA